MSRGKIGKEENPRLSDSRALRLIKLSTPPYVYTLSARYSRPSVPAGAATGSGETNSNPSVLPFSMAGTPFSIHTGAGAPLR